MNTTAALLIYGGLHKRKNQASESLKISGHKAFSPATGALAVAYSGC